MSDDLLIYLSDRITDADAAAIESLAQQVASAREWAVSPPVFIDDTDASSCSRPEDVPIRTVGIGIELPTGDAPRALSAAGLGDLEWLLQVVSQLSASRQLELEVQLNGEMVGVVRDGIQSRALREGLIEPWRTTLNL